MLLSSTFNFNVYADEIVNTTTNISTVDDYELTTLIPYQKYLSKIDNTNKIDFNTIIDIDAASYSDTKGVIEILNNYEGKAGKSVKLSDEGYIEWIVNVPQSGTFNFEMEYYTVKGKGSSIERMLYIDGIVPFIEAGRLVFSRVFTNDNKIIRDTRGNDIRPGQKEKLMWQSAIFSDSIGLINGPLKFYLGAGKHTIRLEAVREPLIIRSLKIFNELPAKTYKEVKENYDHEGYIEVSNFVKLIEGENAELKSDPMLYPISDRSSVATNPSDPAKIRYNTIGGVQWKSTGQWIQWNFRVDKSGLYKIGIKGRQNVNSGLSSSRKIYIDEKVPFKEMEIISFPYNTQWEMYELGGRVTPYMFYLSAGEHSIKLEANIGNMEQIINKVNDSIVNLNLLYRKILMITGPTPDVFRDYQFDATIPDVISGLGEQSKNLKEIYDSILALSNQNGENAQLFNKLYLQTKQMSDKYKDIPKLFNSFRDNIAAIGTWYITAKQQPLEIDYIAVTSNEKELPAATSNFINEFSYTVKSFFASFFEDYNSIGESSSSGIKVWIGNGVTGGRDQAQVLKQMINNTFTSKSNVSVNLELVPMGSLLPATMSGNGPDVALTLGGGDPVNFAVRNSVINLATFKDYPEIAKRFSESALTSMTFRKGVYGLPESQTWYMMFYRKDIMQELGLKIPQTWDDVINILPTLQKQQLTFGLPLPMSDISVGIGFNAYTMFLYQNGGELYEKDGVRALVGSDASIKAFQDWTDFYNNYELPKAYDFGNRFRTGEIPIGISDYSSFNWLSVFAPEIDGLWGFAPIPGVMNEDGVINRSTPCTVTASVILSKTTKAPQSWEFLKWWTSTAIQVEFGNVLESILGPSGRYTPANLDALYQVPWDKKSFDKLIEQQKNVFGIPEVPGSYYTSRYIDFAFKRVVNQKDDVGDVLTDSNNIINLEIATRRNDFGIKD